MAIRDKLNKLIGLGAGPGKGSFRYDPANFNKRLLPSDFAASKSTPYSDVMVNRFAKTNLDTVSDRWERFQDPTILGFKIFFDFVTEDSHLLLGPVYPEATVVPTIKPDTRPSTAGANDAGMSPVMGLPQQQQGVWNNPGTPPPEDPNKDKGNVKVEQVDITTAPPNSALRYLLLIGDAERAGYLLSFQKLLQKMSSEAPWFFQSIEGLEDAWKHGYGDEFRASLPKERQLIINTLDETVDLRITALMDLYRKACFDWPNRREIVPRNLRRFNVNIYIYEARSINYYGDPGNPAKQTTLEDSKNPYLTTVTTQNKGEFDKVFGSIDYQGPAPRIEMVNDNISRVMFNFSLCEWNPDESTGIFSGLSNKELGVKSQKLVFTYRNVIEQNRYNIFHNKLVTDSFIGILDELALDNKDYINMARLDPDPEKGILGGLLESAGKFVQGKMESVVNFLFGNGEDKIGRAYPPTLLEKMLDKLGLGDSPAAIAVAQRALKELEQSTFVNKLQALFMGNVYGIDGGFQFAKVLQQAGSVNGILDAVGVDGANQRVTGNPSLKLDDLSPKASDTAPGIYDASMTNDDGKDSSGYNSNLTGGIGTEMTNRRISKLEGQSVFQDATSSPSLTNDNGNDASGANSEGTIATRQITPIEGKSVFADNADSPSITNDNGLDSTQAGTVTFNDFTSTDGTVNVSFSTAKDSKPSTDQEIGNSSASLTNDNGSDANQIGKIVFNDFDTSDSLANAKGSNPATDQAIGNDSASAANDNGPDAKDTKPGQDNASLSNNKGSNPATDQAIGNDSASAANDNGPDAKDTKPGQDDASLSNI